MIKKTMAILGLGIMLVGCSDAAVEKEEKAPKKNTETNVSTPAVSTPKPVKETTPTPPPVDTKAQALEEYNDLLSGPTMGLTESLGTFAELNDAAAEDPTDRKSVV